MAKKGTIDSSLVDKAIVFATNAHKDVERKGKGFPYIVHPLEAMAIVATMTNDQDLLAAAVLHDVVEDTEYTLEDIRKEFGDKVAEIVDSESDEKIPGLSSGESWKQRKIIAIERLKNASIESKMVAMGDKLSNMRAIYRDYLSLGEGVWDKFHVKDVKEHEWHYRGLADSLSDLKYTEAYKEFADLIEKVFNK
ncbi:MAG: HD domain-containing protein [Bacilli bacterium]|nr:HD domain-containing protein [Bacilli bacterium]